MNHLHSGIRRGSRRLIAVVAVLGVLLAGGLVEQASPAYAANYPSWQDVLNSRANEAAKTKEVSRIEALLAQLEANVVATAAVAEQKGEEFAAAQQAYDESAFRLTELQAQADAAKAAADESLLKAGQMAARSQRAGGADLTATLMFTESDDLLSQLGMASKVGEQSSGIYIKAKQDQNSAQHLTNQATIAEAALEVLATEAEIAMAEAQAAAAAAEAAVEEQSANQARLQAQLATLVENRIATEAEFNKGEQIRLELERQRKAAEAAAAAAAAAAAGGGQASGSGWARPSSGHISSNYGPRVAPKKGASTLHAGVDLAPGCNAPIYAASAGRVVFAGAAGGYGNYIKINHPDGSQTAYAHIVSGGILVGSGQYVNAGQQIARVGTTGTSTGCHLHFELRVGGSTTNPVTYLRFRGVGI